MMNFILRLVLFMLGLVFAASLAVAVLLLAAVWGVRYGWARLTGRPVTPWVMRFNPGAGFNRFRAAAQPVEPSAADVVSARALGESSERPVRVHGVGGGVTDVQPK
ncbi:hypothetical protein H7F36_20930 [Variovorax sp. PAMC28562]|nr:hypothetical protein H7F36_20930 [Variovorax sp. PAMC28562]